MYICTFLLRMADTMTSQNIDLSSFDTLYIKRSFGRPFGERPLGGPERRRRINEDGSWGDGV
jgi:hypothetical protein